MLFRKKKEENRKSKVMELNSDNFESFIKSNSNAVVDCYNDHCAPCRRIHPMIYELSEKYEGKIGFGRLNTDYSVEIAVKYGVMGVPTILFFKDGKLVNSMKEVKSMKHLEDAVLKHAEVKE